MISPGETASDPRAWWSAAVEELWLVVPPGVLISVELTFLKEAGSGLCHSFILLCRWICLMEAAQG